MRPHYSPNITFGVALIWCAVWSGSARAAGITAVGGWSRPITADDLLAGAGSDLVTLYESVSNATLLSLDEPFFTRWRVSVRKADTTWDPTLALYVRRTGNGTGFWPVSGGTSYQLVTDTDTVLFSGIGDRNSVPVQYKLSGVSVQLTPRTYSATVTFTVATY
ncbi:MAG: hypothetical protein FJX75_19975 [Armatimonadetes bacterium]|nr:hypothetical protein [Armatimonadota bacterium]